MWGTSLRRVYLNKDLKEVSEVDIWGKNVLGRENSKHKVPEVGCAWLVGGHVVITKTVQVLLLYSYYIYI